AMAIVHEGMRRWCYQAYCLVFEAQTTVWVVLRGERSKTSAAWHREGDYPEPGSRSLSHVVPSGRNDRQPLPPPAPLKTLHRPCRQPTSASEGMRFAHRTPGG